MSLIVFDVINLCYFTLKQTIKGLYYGSAWAYNQWSATPPPLAIEANPNPPDEQQPQLSLSERRLLQAFQGLPNYVREQQLSEVLYKHNSQALANFSFGDQGREVLLQFNDLRNDRPIAIVGIRLDAERRIEELRQAFREFQTLIHPNLHACDWYILRTERQSEDGQSTYFQKYFVLNSDSLMTLDVDESSNTLNVSIDF